MSAHKSPWKQQLSDRNVATVNLARTLISNGVTVFGEFIPDQDESYATPMRPLCHTHQSKSSYLQDPEIWNSQTGLHLYWQFHPLPARFGGGMEQLHGAAVWFLIYMTTIGSFTRRVLWCWPNISHFHHRVSKVLDKMLMYSNYARTCYTSNLLFLCNDMSLMSMLVARILCLFFTQFLCSCRNTLWHLLTH